MAHTVPTQTKSTLDLTRSTVVKDVLECRSNFRASVPIFLTVSITLFSGGNGA